MPKIRKEWQVVPSNAALKKEMSAYLGVSEIITQVLINRGITDKDIAKDFLFGGSEKLGDPYLLKDMEKAEIQSFTMPIWIQLELKISAL